MSEEPLQLDPFDLAKSVAEGAEAVLAMLLIARRVNIENIALVGPGLARVELSGDAIEQGLTALAQVMTLTPPKRRKKHDDDEDEALPPPSFWQALKEFALPPVRKKD